MKIRTRTISFLFFINFQENTGEKNRQNLYPFSPPESLFATNFWFYYSTPCKKRKMNHYKILAFDEYDWSKVKILVGHWSVFSTIWLVSIFNDLFISQMNFCRSFDENAEKCDKIDNDLTSVKLVAASLVSRISYSFPFLKAWGEIGI